MAVRRGRRRREGDRGARRAAAPPRPCGRKVARTRRIVGPSDYRGVSVSGLAGAAASGVSLTTGARRRSVAGAAPSSRGAGGRLDELVAALVEPAHTPLPDEPRERRRRRYWPGSRRRPRPPPRCCPARRRARPGPSPASDRAAPACAPTPRPDAARATCVQRAWRASRDRRVCSEVSRRPARMHGPPRPDVERAACARPAWRASRDRPACARVSWRPVRADARTAPAAHVPPHARARPRRAPDARARARAGAAARSTRRAPCGRDPTSQSSRRQHRCRRRIRRHAARPRTLDPRPARAPPHVRERSLCE